jgi:hypothetical protein
MDHGRENHDSGEQHERVQSPLRWHSGPTPGVTILVPPAVTIAVPKTPHNRLLHYAESRTTRDEILILASWLQQMPKGYVSKLKDMTLNRQNVPGAIMPGTVNNLLTLKRHTHSPGSPLPRDGLTVLKRLDI